MKKNDLHLGDDGEFTVDLDVPVKPAANIQKSKRQSETKQKHAPITRIDTKMSQSESPLVLVLATLLIMFVSFHVISILGMIFL
jgi:hypothetical protein